MEKKNDPYRDELFTMIIYIVFINMSNGIINISQQMSHQIKSVARECDIEEEVLKHEDMNTIVNKIENFAMRELECYLRVVCLRILNENSVEASQ